LLTSVRIEVRLNATALISDDFFRPAAKLTLLFLRSRNDLVRLWENLPV
jgi:hypothetical protein